MSVLLILCFPKAAPAQRCLVYMSVDIFKNTFFFFCLCLFSEIINVSTIAEPEVNQKPNENNNRVCSRGLFHSSDLTNLSFDHKLLSWCTLMKLWVCIFFTAVLSWVNELQVWVMCAHHGGTKPTLMEAWHCESPWQLSTRGRPCTLVRFEEAILILKVWRYCQICGTDWRSVGVSGRRQKEFIE